jgi:hypothetical protein
MAFNLPGVPSQISSEQAGHVSLLDSIMRGLKLNDQYQETKYKPKQLAEALLGEQLANKIKGVQARYAEPMASVGLQQAQGNLGLLPYREQLLKARAQAALHPQAALSNFEKAIQGQQRIIQQFGQDSPQAKAANDYIQKLSAGSNGISVSIDPETGQPLVQIGGSGGRGKGAGMVVNPATGEIFSSPTNTVATKLQNKIIGEQQLEPIMKDIINTVPQFQSGWKEIQRDLVGVTNRWLGTDFRQPSEAKMGQAALTKATESLIGLYGLYGNAHNVKKVSTILEPGKGESPAGYKDRVKKEMDTYVKSLKTSQSQLGRGISVNSPNKNTKNDPLGIR